MSAVWLEKRDPARNLARFDAITVTPTLFGAWALGRAWGRSGQPGTVREAWFATAELAATAGLQLIRRKERRGSAKPPGPLMGGWGTGTALSTPSRVPLRWLTAGELRPAPFRSRRDSRDS